MNLIAQFFSKRMLVIATAHPETFASDIDFIPRKNLSFANRPTFIICDLRAKSACVV
jgi:hypothetical protein